MDQQAVRHANDSVEFGRETSQRLKQAGMALHLHIKVGDDAIERSTVLVELIVFLCDLLQGIAHVEGEALFL